MVGADCGKPDRADLQQHDRIQAEDSRGVRCGLCHQRDHQYARGADDDLDGHASDLAEDAARGRLYLPREILDAHGLTQRDPQAVLDDPTLPAACRALAAVAEKHFIDAQAAMDACEARAMRPARAMMRYYRALYDQLLKNDWQNPQIRVRLPFWRKLLIAFQGLLD